MNILRKICTVEHLLLCLCNSYTVWPPRCACAIFDCALILQFLHPTHVTSSSNSLHHLNVGLPLLLSPFPPGLVQKTFFAGSISSILSTCTAHVSLPRLIHSTTSYSSQNLCISEFLHLFQHPFSSTKPNIFCRTFLSKYLRRFSHFLAIAQVLEPYVSSCN